MVKRLQLKLGKNHELIPYVDDVPIDGVIRVDTSYDRSGARVRIELIANAIDFDVKKQT